MRPSTLQPPTSVSDDAPEVAILGRLFLNGEGRLRPRIAHHILSLGFSDEDKARMHELAVKNQQGRIESQELRELDGYLKAGDLLAILKSKARRLLKIKPK